MTGYPRNDGSWSFYVLQSWYDRDPKNEWGIYSWYEKYDTREFIESMAGVYEETTLNASGRVWQEAGIHGTTDSDYAIVLLRLLRRDHPEHEHRIVKMTVSRVTEVV